ncbi:hypothetical protein ERO13_A05G388600v2 [Gossypium hirsutum]|nr:hypothetical protein ERO13_A05G388600v2 [Gossypium hirsutum]
MVGTQTMVSFGHFLLPDLDPKPKHAETLRPLRRIEKMIQFPLLRSPKKVLTLTWKRTEAIRRQRMGCTTYRGAGPRVSVSETAT